MTDKKEELNQLSHQCIMDKFDLSYVDQFKNFQIENQEDEELLIECKYQIGFIYFFQEMHQESAEVLLPLIEERKKIDDFKFSTLVSVVLKSLSKLNQLDLAKTIFERFIDDPCNDGFYQIEGMLEWLVTAIDPSETELHVYKPKLQKLMNELGYFPNRSTIKESILDIRSVHQKANRKFSEICIAYRKTPTSETIQSLNDFIESNPPGYYKALAEDFKKKIESNSSEGND